MIDALDAIGAIVALRVLDALGVMVVLRGGGASFQLAHFGGLGFGGLKARRSTRRERLAIAVMIVMVMVHLGRRCFDRCRGPALDDARFALGVRLPLEHARLGGSDLAHDALDFLEPRFEHQRRRGFRRRFGRGGRRRRRAREHRRLFRTDRLEARGHARLDGVALRKRAGGDAGEVVAHCVSSRYNCRRHGVIARISLSRQP
jgi:hypothetical protein